VIRAESEFDVFAVSSKGAQGLMQLMPATARRFGVTDPFDPRQNIFAGTQFLRILLDLFDGDVALALAGYNAGENAVRRYKGIPPYRETRGYVTKVQSYLGATTYPLTNRAASYAPVAGVRRAASRSARQQPPAPLAPRIYYRYRDARASSPSRSSPPTRRDVLADPGGWPLMPPSAEQGLFLKHFTAGKERYDAGQLAEAAATSRRRTCSARGITRS